MTPPKNRAPAQHPEMKARHAPLNSVSTRIILCVFVSTLITALVVSWLAVGAVHRDVRRQVGEHARALLDERGREIEAWIAQASTRLAAATAIGTEWHGALVAQTTDQTATEHHWTTASLGDESLPTPPADVAPFFDRLSLYADTDSEEAESGCLWARAELVRADTQVAGFVEGCLAQSVLYDLLQPPTRHRHGTRLMIADTSGRIVAAAGLRAQARIGSSLPLARLLYGEDSGLVTYRNDEGNKLVGLVAPLGRSGWSLVAEVEHARAFSPAIAITNQILIVDICIILLFSVLAYKIARAIMAPIEALSAGARQIAEGHVDYEIPAPANDDDELGVLTHSFNTMMGRLRSNQLEIEQDRLRLEEKNEELQRANEILAQLSITDGLTKLHNHRYFQDHLTREIKRVSRTRAPLALILLDIDDFKLLNDRHGHAAGDEVLVSLAGIMNDSARESDLIARYGGEEFVILMPNTDLAGAVHLAEKIRMAVESTRLIIGDNMKPIDITISLGVALFGGNRREFFAEADKALYRAKAAGKNCVIIAGSDDAESI